jgi:hypothetical protein
MKLFRRTSNPLFVEDQHYDWGKKSNPAGKFIWTLLLVAGVIGFIMLVIP